MQTKADLDDWYKDSDPWGYETNLEDIERKKRILKAIPGKYKRALDIGCGEGWITQDLPAKEIHGLELSDKASARFPKNVKRVTEPEGMYDLIVCTGVLYAQYDWEQVLKWIQEHSSGTVLIAGISDWLLGIEELGVPDYFEEFPYREYTQWLGAYS